MKNIKTQFTSCFLVSLLTIYSSSAWANNASIKQIQFSLIALGHMQGQITGIEDSATNTALQSYLTAKKIHHNDKLLIAEHLLKSVEKTKSDVLIKNLQYNLHTTKQTRQELSDRLSSNPQISIKDLDTFKYGKVIFVTGKTINVDANKRFASNTKVIIIDSLINSKSRYRNEFNVQFQANSALFVINAASDSKRNTEAFNFTYSSKANAFHSNYQHNLGDPWQVAKQHRGELSFNQSTCNVTLLEKSRTKLTCRQADRLMIEPILPKGRFTASLPSYQQVDHWQSHKSLPWDINIHDSYVEHIDLGLSAGVNLSIVDTEKYSGGWAMCCKGSGRIKGLRANKTYAKESWSVASEQGNSRLTLINSSIEGMWPTAWGDYRFTIVDSDLIDPAAGSNAKMIIQNSHFNLISAQDGAIVQIVNSTILDADIESKKITARDRSKIYLQNIKGLKASHIIEVGNGKVIIKD